MVVTKRKWAALGVLLAAVLVLAFGQMPKAVAAEEVDPGYTLGDVAADASVTENDADFVADDMMVGDDAAAAPSENEPAIGDAPSEEAPAEDNNAVVEEEPSADNAARANANTSGSNDGIYWVLAGSSVTINGSRQWSSSNSDVLNRSTFGTLWNASSNVSAVTLVTLSSTDWWGNEEEKAQVIIIPRTITARTYLRMDNSIPPTLQAYGTSAYSPDGNNRGYNDVVVSVEAMLEAGAKPYVKVGSYSTGTKPCVYFSFESDGSDGGTDQAQRKVEAETYWDSIIKPNITSGLDELNSHFSKPDDYFGFVLKLEGTDSRWHLDGSLRKNPPIYSVELYEENSNKHLFMVDASGKNVSGVDYDEFLTKLSEYLGVSNKNDLVLTASDDGRGATVSYSIAGITYTREITPRTNSTKPDVGAKSAIKPSEKKFSYGVATENVWWACELNISQPSAQVGNLTLKKVISGDIANPTKHYKFQLTCSTLGNKNCALEVSGQAEGDAVTHDDTVAFTNGVAVVELAGNETAAIKDLPSDAAITVEEVGLENKAGMSTSAQTGNSADDMKPAGVTETFNADKTTKTVKLNDSVSPGKIVQFTNTANLQPATGIRTTITPFVALLAAAGAGIGIIAAQRHRAAAANGSDHDSWKE